MAMRVMFQKSNSEKFSSMIRSQVASEVVLKKVPKLKFVYDNTLYEANSIDDLLKSLNE